MNKEEVLRVHPEEDLPVTPAAVRKERHQAAVPVDQEADMTEIRTTDTAGLPKAEADPAEAPIATAGKRRK